MKHTLALTLTLAATVMPPLAGCGGADRNGPPALPSGEAVNANERASDGGSANAGDAATANDPQARKVAVISASVKPTPGSTTSVKAVTLADKLDHPWALAFLPDGRMLVTERRGTMQIITSKGSVTSLSPVSGLLPVHASGQGGLLDVVVEPTPEDATQPWVYWSFSEPGTGTQSGLNGTAVARGRLLGQKLEDVSVVFQQKPKTDGSGHYGSRLVFAKDGSLFVTLGERQLDSPSSPKPDNAQNLNKHLGKVVRINKDGTPYGGNPKWDGAAALPEIWSTGHRNPQGAALHPTTGELWLSEHGPQGGDEINIARAGLNYGWPMRSYGCQYGSILPNEICRAGGGVHAPEFTEPLTYWVPYSMAPSGLAFYTADKLPAWQGKLFMGALSGRAVWQLTLKGNSVSSREELFKDAFGRIRDVRQGPDGWLYLLTDDDNGKLIRIEQ